MSKKSHSPYASSFKSGINRGTPCGTVIENISSRTGKSAKTIIMSLCKAGLCCCQKFNGQMICWPTFKTRKSATNASACQAQMWQCFVDWCMCSGCCTPTQLTNKTGSQKSFMSSCRSLFGKQFSSSKKSKTSKRSKRKSWTSKKRSSMSKSKAMRHAKKRTGSWTKSNSTWYSSDRTYKFPTYKSRSTTRRYARAA